LRPPPAWTPATLLDKGPFPPVASAPMASEIFGTAALFWVLIPVGLAGGALLLKLLKD
jgi:cytochrome b6-f complex subunit 7